VELGVAEQRYRAVLEVLDEGASVTDVARRYGVARQTVHTPDPACVAKRQLEPVAAAGSPPLP
jgi:DNA invertase Pin-like site-specific DNA recombinase